MATFNFFSNILPDPVYKITDAGDQDVTGTPGPGFAGVNFRSVRDSQVSKTLSNRTIGRDSGKHAWEFSIKYNPMFRASIEPVLAFLDGRNARTKPFYVVLPQYSRPQSDAFNTFALTYVIKAKGYTPAGSSVLEVNTTVPFTAYPKPGDMFTVADPLDANHLKVYKVSAVETSARYQAGTTAPTSSELRLHIAPPLVRTVNSNTTVLTFINPKFRVSAKNDIQEYELNTEGLYSYSLDVEETLP